MLLCEEHGTDSYETMILSLQSLDGKWMTKAMCNVCLNKFNYGP